jgi:hypothetical protein
VAKLDAVESLARVGVVLAACCCVEAATDVVLRLLLLVLLLLVEAEKRSSPLPFPGRPRVRQLVRGEEGKLVFPVERVSK